MTLGSWGGLWLSAKTIRPFYRQLTSKVSSARRSLHTVFSCWKILKYQPVRKWDLKAALTITPIWNFVLNVASLPVYTFVFTFLLGIFITFLYRQGLYLIYPGVPLKPKTLICRMYSINTLWIENKLWNKTNRLLLRNIFITVFWNSVA